MTSIDDLFKKPNLPIGSGKRKFEEPDAQQAYKSTKVSDSSSPHTNGKASVEDALDDDEDMEAGPSLPPDEDEGDEDDEDDEDEDNEDEEADADDEEEAEGCGSSSAGPL